MSRLAIRRADAADAALVRDISRTAYAKWLKLIGRELCPLISGAATVAS